MTSPHHAPEPPHEPAASQDTPPAAESDTQSGSKTDAGSIGLIILVILAVIASLVMLISGSANALKIALLASLWAAVLGFFLVVRYRRQAQEAKELLAVERAHAASALTASGAGAADNSEVLAEIRSELESIRSQIEELSGREWVYEPAALYAEARRIQELERKAGSAGVDERGDANSVNFTQKSGGAPTADAVAGRLGTQPTHPVSNPLDSLLADSARAGQPKPAPKPETQKPAAPKPEAQKPASTPKTQPAPQPKSQQGSRPASFGAPRPDQGLAPAFRPMGEPKRESEPAAKPAAKPHKPAAPSSETTKQPEFRTDSFQAVRWNQGAAEQPAPHHRHRKPETDNTPSSSAQVQSQQAAQSSRGRRRSDEKREGAVSVAELMARRQQQQDKDGKK